MPVISPFDQLCSGKKCYHMGRRSLTEALQFFDCQIHGDPATVGIHTNADAIIELLLSGGRRFGIKQFALSGDVLRPLREIRGEALMVVGRRYLATYLKHRWLVDRVSGSISEPAPKGVDLDHDALRMIERAEELLASHPFNIHAIVFANIPANHQPVARRLERMERDLHVHVVDAQSAAPLVRVK